MGVVAPGEKKINYCDPSINGLQTAESFSKIFILFALTLSKPSFNIIIKDSVKLRFILRTADVVGTLPPLSPQKILESMGY